MRNYIFKPGWIPSICVLFLLPLFVALGIWQLHRADEKTALTALRASHEREPAILLSGHDQGGEALRYRRVSASGVFDVQHQFLLDNQIRERQPGYQVLTPLVLKSGGLAVLVNRGWVPLGADRGTIPDLRMERTEAQISGKIENFPRVGFKLKGAEIPAPGWPSLVQVLDAEQLSRRLGYRVLPYQVLLDPDQRDGYVREWNQPSLQPEKNQGYALQWFSFALVLTALYIWYGLKPRSRV